MLRRHSFGLSTPWLTYPPRKNLSYINVLLKLKIAHLEIYISIKMVGKEVPGD